MSIENFLADQHKTKPSRFKDVAGKLLSKKEPEDSRPWKWEEEISNEKLDEMENKLEQLRLYHQFTTYLKAVFYLRSIDPERPLNIDKRMLRIARQEWKKNTQNGESLSSTMQGVPLNLLDPHRGLTMTDDTWESMEIERDKNSSFMPYYLENSSFMHLLDPKREIYISESAHLQINEYLEQEKNNNRWGSFALISSEMRLLDPSRPPISDETQWQGMKKDLKSLRTKSDDNWFHILVASVRLRILAAHKVEVTKNGILITDKNPFPLDITIPSRPVRKKI